MDAKYKTTLEPNSTEYPASQTDTHNWMIAIYYYLKGRKGISTIQLLIELGVQYRIARHMGHRTRAACKEGRHVIPDKIVEMDATYIDGKRVPCRELVS